MLTWGSEDDPRVGYLARRGFPFVSHGRVVNAGHPYRWHDTDGAAAFARAFELLYRLGHRHFALVSTEERRNYRRLRTAGLLDAIARRGDPTVRLDTIASTQLDREGRAARSGGR